jgi:hypothetical protein
MSKTNKGNLVFDDAWLLLEKDAQVRYLRKKMVELLNIIEELSDKNERAFQQARRIISEFQDKV